MSVDPWATLSDERLLKYKVFDVRKTTRRSPRTGEDIGFFVIDTLDWVNVVAFTPEHELLMIRQYRHGSRDVTLEIPGGVVHEGEDLALAAMRELREETGYRAERVVRIGSVSPNPALFTNACATYLAEGCQPDGELIQDPGEDIEVVRVPWVEVERMVGRGEISHALVVAGLYFYRLHAAPR
ncbi:MAG: NUDIX hydrolase [Planctomycetes bacterium]|nr:NUDIX hydrolase [Planctomycetota bacterium]MCB9870591.1 NUDIX hydrolase [Planctomycetota bacterium]